MEEDLGAFQVELGLLRDNMATAASAANSLPLAPQTSVVTAGARQKEHLTQRKGFDGLPTYGGGAQWEDW